MKFRKANASDIPTLNKISVESKMYWGYPDEWMEKWIDELTLSVRHLSDQTVIVAEMGFRLTGFCSIKERLENHEILHLWLLPEFIGKGYGKKLLGHTMTYCVKDEKPVIVEADPNAEGFYKSQGFQTFGKIESYPQGRFLPVMKKINANHNQLP